MSCQPMRKDPEPEQALCLKKSRQQYYEDLMACAGQSSSNVWLAQIIASWLVGAGVLPDYLGLTPVQFQQLQQQYFSGYSLPVSALSGLSSDFSRMLEKQDLEELLRRFAAPAGVDNEWLISMIVAASLGSDHLWQDLGLWSRQDLTAMLAQHFPELTVRNSKDMKWKKFLYKQLCEAEGLYVCRAPSCEVCLDYHNCFGAEE